MKADFIEALHQAVMEIDEAKYVFNYCFDHDGNLLPNGIEKIMTEHWRHIMNGTYGVLKRHFSKEYDIKKYCRFNINLSKTTKKMKNIL